MYWTGPGALHARAMCTRQCAPIPDCQGISSGARHAHTMRASRCARTMQNLRYRSRALKARWGFLRAFCAHHEGNQARGRRAARVLRAWSANSVLRTESTSALFQPPEHKFSHSTCLFQFPNTPTPQNTSNNNNLFNSLHKSMISIIIHQIPKINP